MRFVLLSLALTLTLAFTRASGGEAAFGSRGEDDSYITEGDETRSPRSVEQQVDALIKLLRDLDASECGDRKITYDNLTGDAVPVAVVIFYICGFAGGNNESYYVAVFEAIEGAEEIPLTPEAKEGFTVRPDGRIFLRDGEEIIAPKPTIHYALIDFTLAGERSQRQIHRYLGHTGTLDSKDGVQLLFETGEYARGDAPCCPSKGGRLTYQLLHRRLVER